MVGLGLVRASNANLPDFLPEDLVAVFTGGTSGIAEATLKLLAGKAIRPRIYIVGRDFEAAAGIIAECRTINPGGDYLFIRKNLLLMKEVEEMCEEIKKKETHINILCLAAGAPDRSLEMDAQGFRPLFAILLFSRILATIRLLPLLNAAQKLKRVLSVAGGGYEGIVDTNDWQAVSAKSPFALRSHFASMMTLAFRRLQLENSEVSFVLDHPGVVVTKSIGQTTGLYGFVVRSIVFLFGRWITVPLDESAERHLFMATSSAFPPAKGDAGGAPLVTSLEICGGADGDTGSGLYSVVWNNEGPGEKIVALLNDYERDGTAQKTWGYVQGELLRIEQEKL